MTAVRQGWWMRAGDLIADRFRPDSLAFRDPLNEIWYGTDTVLDRPVTIRFVTPPPHADPGWSSRFLHTYRGLATLPRTHIAEIHHAAALDGGRHVLVTEPVAGRRLSREPHRRPPAEAGRILRQVATALRAAFYTAGICHGALLPENVLVEEDGNVTVYGFGTASLPPPSPARHLDDLYDLGALAYELITGHPPAPEAPAYPAGPPRLVSIAMGLLGLPELRPSLDEVIDRLEIFLSPEPRPLPIVPPDPWNGDAHPMPDLHPQQGGPHTGQEPPDPRVEGPADARPGPSPPHDELDVEDVEEAPRHDDDKYRRRQAPISSPDEPGTPVERRVNVCFVDRQRTPVPPSISLAAGRSYALRLDIGARAPESIVRNPEPFPDELLPPSATGHWLTVSAVSDDFTLGRHRHPYFLPRIGSGWRCDCLQDEAHSCTAWDRAPYLFLPVTAPARPGPARLRASVYFRGNLLQSLDIFAEITETERLGQGTGAWIDFSMAGGLLHLDPLPPRDISVLTAGGQGGTHTLVFGGLTDQTVAFHLTEGQMSGAIEAARTALRDLHMYGGRNLLDARNGKRPDELIADLGRLAPLGQRLWNLLAVQHDALRDRMRETLTIQVVRGGPSTFVYPWALVYDIGLESDPARHLPCPVVGELGAAAEAPPSCPYEAGHGLNTLCPYGFWGFRHLIEQPPSMPPTRTLPVTITSRVPADMVLGISRRLDRNRSQRHLAALGERLPGIRFDVCDSVERLKRSLGRADLPLVYFYCHGRRGTDGAYLEIGAGDKVAPEDVSAWFQWFWPADHWRVTPPLVFINGCHTVELTPDTLTQFVDAFAAARAAGVIGTETAVHENLAGEVAELFWAGFRSGRTVGEALAVMRRGLLAKGNLLGLTYTAYCSAALSLRTGG